MAPETVEILYANDVAWQTLTDPLIAPGCAGIALVLTAKVRAVLFPQLLLAVTEIVPAELPATTEMDAEVELPLPPEGNVQV